MLKFFVVVELGSATFRDFLLLTNPDRPNDHPTPSNFGELLLHQTPSQIEFNLNSSSQPFSSCLWGANYTTNPFSDFVSKGSYSRLFRASNSPKSIVWTFVFINTVFPPISECGGRSSALLCQSLTPESTIRELTSQSDFVACVFQPKSNLDQQN